MTKHQFFPPGEVEGLDHLYRLALDLRWSWNHSGDELWGQIDAEAWSLTQSPWVVLQVASITKLKELAADAEFAKKISDLIERQREALDSIAWFQKEHSNSTLESIAYFSMEFMLSEALPIYSGGLGNVAGDQLKSASDLGVPIIGVGLLYQQGYFRQVLDAYGKQTALYPSNDPSQLPITPVRDESGEWVRIEISFPGYKIWLRAWQAQVGRVRLYLLDSNDPANPPTVRCITSELYGGGQELRLQQELILGLGGWRLLHTLGIEPDVCHLNEGHAAFVVLERARFFMMETGQPFEVALTATRAGNIFTTHTPVAAGFDRFPPAVIEPYLWRYIQHNSLGVDLKWLMGLGRLNPKDSAEPFNMAYLAIRGSGAINGVSQLHGKVSRKIFQPLFPAWPEIEVPIGHVTNGVHVPSWDSAEGDKVWTDVCGKDRWRDTMETITEKFRSVSDDTLWELRSVARQKLIKYARERYARQLASSGASREEIDQAHQIFDHNTLTIGFARRFAVYKRPNLLLYDADRLVRLIANPRCPIQLIVAGKAHPNDLAGQAMIEEWFQFFRKPEVHHRAIFLSDYDMVLTELLVQGVDLWINTPRRPWEASGTSGMKVLANGGLNLSELDGWWAEAYAPGVGWALGDGQEHGDDPAWDKAEAEALYILLEEQVIPAFYKRDEKGIPRDWVSLMRESMARLTPRFSANRVVRQYTQEYYIPAAANYHKRAADKGSLGTKILMWQNHLSKHWSSLHFGQMWVETDDKAHVFRLQVWLGELDPQAVQVELYADNLNGEDPFREIMTLGDQLAGSVNGYLFYTRVSADRPSNDYTPRIIPNPAIATVPLEAAHIIWYK